ncbi:MAG: hypothetical protein KJ709_08690 [Nanoarchaeota archaeon]|nr:hypothetical protein [Nanoarchaeota archaeon]
MARIRLLAVGKSERHNHYTFRKEQVILLVIRNLLEELRFEGSESESFGRPEDKDGNPIFNEVDDVKDYIDRRFKFEKEGYYIEVIFGKDKVFLSVHSDEDMQDEITAILRKFIKDQD